MGRRVRFGLVIALVVAAVVGSGWAYVVARGIVPRAKSVPSVMPGSAGTAMAPAPGTPDVIGPPGEIDRGFRLPTPPCSIDPGFHLRIPNIDRIDLGFGPVPSPPPALPRCSDMPAPATPVPRR